MNRIPWAINVQTKCFRDIVRQKQNQQEASDRETVTINSGNTSGVKTVREIELEKKNEQ